MGFTALGGASIGMLYTLYNLMITAEDEDGEPVYNKIPDHEKARNMLLLMPDEISMKSGEGFKIEKFGETKNT